MVHSTVIKSRSTFALNQSLWAFRGRRSIPYNYCILGGALVSDPGYVRKLNPQSKHLDYNNSLRDNSKLRQEGACSAYIKSDVAVLAEARLIFLVSYVRNKIMHKLS